MNDIAERQLELLDRRKGERTNCTVSFWRTDGTYTIRVVRGDGALLNVSSSSEDFEGALQDLRSFLDSQGLLLLCNRFRSDAFVSSMSRQMTDGLGCYLVRVGRPVDPSQIVDVLDPAPAELVTTQAQASAFLSRWMDSFGA